MLDAKALAQAAMLDDAAKALKQAGYANRRALHAVRQVQAELNGIEVETVTAKSEEDKAHGITYQDEARAA